MKPDVLFIGGANGRKNGLAGGQLKAARTLLDSKLHHFFNWIIIDSTTNERREKSIILRFAAAKFRFIKLLWMLLTRRFEYAVIFVGHGFGFIEKSIMAILLNALGRKVL